MRYPSPHIEARHAHTYTLDLDLTVIFEISGKWLIGYLWTPFPPPPLSWPHHLSSIPKWFLSGVLIYDGHPSSLEFIEGGRKKSSLSCQGEVHKGRLRASCFRWSVAHANTPQSQSLSILWYAIPFKRLCIWTVIWGWCMCKEKSTCTVYLGSSNVSGPESAPLASSSIRAGDD